MSKHLERDLQAVEQDVLAQSALVEEMIGKAFRALCERRADMSMELFEKEAEINVREVQLEEECLKILALHQPVAVDLRRTATILKINGDLERIADLALNIAERARDSADHSEIQLPANLERMVRLATSMVHNALDSFVEQDAQLARDVCRQDDDVDDLNIQVINELVGVMRSDPDSIEPALHLFSASRQVERIADHATNIAEDVIYLVEGDIARHHPKPADKGITSG